MVQSTVVRASGFGVSGFSKLAAQTTNLATQPRRKVPDGEPIQQPHQGTFCITVRVFGRQDTSGKTVASLQIAGRYDTGHALSPCESFARLYGYRAPTGP